MIKEEEEEGRIKVFAVAQSGSLNTLRGEIMAVRVANRKKKGGMNSRPNGGERDGVGWEY